MHIFYLKDVSHTVEKRGDFRDITEHRYLITAIRTEQLPGDPACHPGQLCTAQHLVNMVNNGHRVIVEPNRKNMAFAGKITVLHLAPGFKVKS